MPKLVILVSGYKRAGKDFVSDLISKELTDHNISNETMAFAAPMKRIIAATFGVPLNDLERFKNEPAQYKVKLRGIDMSDEYIGDTDFRAILQNFGSEAMKPEFGENVWSKLMATNLDKSTSDVVIITDFRFDSEYKYLANEGFNVSHLFINSMKPEVVDTHASEALPVICNGYVIDNIAQDSSINPLVTVYVEHLKLLM